MRRVLAAAVAASVLLLSACSDDDTAQESATEDTASSTASEDAAPTTAGDTVQESASAPRDDASQTTSAPQGGGAEGGKAGQAAADRAKTFLVALVAGDPAVCDSMLDFSSEGPMPESPDYDACQETIPPQAEDQFSAEEQQVFEAITITGADVNQAGDSAVVDADNFSDLFAKLGDQEITLTKIDDRWYVDFNSFSS